ncbi:glycosyltransferase family 2 protein [Serratia bockelmannii]|uniref:glycosyltransferase family 2 protein n=1 Tax=Serratia bockelmannii TaxID=2703793 RepID=UPI00313C9B8A
MAKTPVTTKRGQKEWMDVRLQMKSETSDIVDLTIVIPVYNVENYVFEAVQSVINLNPRPAQVVIINDGSTDKSLDILNSEFAKYEFVEIHSTKNNGLGVARNIGTSFARCKYVYYFDSDDLLDPGLTAKFSMVLNETPDLELFVFSAKSFYDSEISNTKDIRKLPDYARNMTARFNTGEECFIALSKQKRFFPNAWMYIFKKSIIEDNELKFKPIIHEDEDFTPQLFFKSKLTYVCNDKFFLRRIRMGSIMQSRFTEKNIIGYIESIYSQGELFMYPGLEKDTRRLLLQRIRGNLINILAIKRSSNLTLSSKVNVQVTELFDKYATVLEKIAVNNFIFYKIINIPIKALRKLTYR